ncbi:MAG: pseudouridine synthase [Chloroflexota bacterium]
MSSTPLLKALTRAGIGPRRRLADAIREGRVTVNGTVAEDFRQPVDTATDHITVGGQPVNLKPPPAVYLLMNKPAGVLSTTRDTRGERTVIDLLPPRYRRPGLYPVGRLDKASTGLLLLTNDGELTYRLTHPRFEHEKEYRVQLARRLEPEQKGQLERGIKLEDGLTYPAVVREAAAPTPSYHITIHEGRKRQIRRMFQSLGHRVLSLQRVRLGSLALGNLKEGEVRELSHREVRALRG